MFLNFLECKTQMAMEWKMENVSIQHLHSKNVDFVAECVVGKDAIVDMSQGTYSIDFPSSLGIR